MNIVKQMRIQLGDTQKELAQKLIVSPDTVKSWELGRRQPTVASVEMLMLLNQDPNLIAALEDLHPIHCMAKNILEYINEQENLLGDDIKLRFVLCGPSGCGKSRAVDIVNDKRSKDSELAENNELIHRNYFCKALGIVNDKELTYSDSKHIAFSVLSEELASSLESNGIKVFRF